jgi:uncharacterized protein YciI
VLFIVTLNYRRPAGELDAHLDAHRGWLAAHTRSGRFIAAGPLAPKTGGLIVASCATRAELDALLADDPFVLHELVDVHVAACTPALRHADFPERWASGAKAVA